LANLVTLLAAHNCDSKLRPGLPDGLFSNQKYQFGSILEVHAMEDVGSFYDHWVYFTTIGYILCPFGIFYGHLVYFSRFGMLY
jgi:hypothetical protein